MIFNGLTLMRGILRRLSHLLITIYMYAPKGQIYLINHTPGIVPNTNWFKNS